MKTYFLDLSKNCSTNALNISLIKNTLQLMLLIVLSHNSMAQNQPSEFVRNAAVSVERMLYSTEDTAIISFIEQSMAREAVRDRNSLVDKLKDIRRAMRGLRDNITIEAVQDGVMMIMSDGKVEKHLRIVLDFEAKAIADLYLTASPEQINLTIDNLPETFEQLERDGMAGVIYVRINDEVILKRAFGPANQHLGYPNTINTIFGTGSRPIDYTVAAIYLLDQRGLLNLEDKINRYFSNVPEDKSSMTIHHLLTGQSGLPDFFHTDDDWDPDLAWIDRQTAVERLLSQNLIFEPGTDRAHSHGAFGLLAALIEIVTNKTYYNFLKENFFEPAGMNRTGEYGEAGGFTISDFAAGFGPQIVGLPNIPPNWGPTSWLVKGSGGMYSTLDDLLRFYSYVRSGRCLDAEHGKVFRQATVNVDGSVRGFELFSAYMPPNNEIYLFLNKKGSSDKMRQLFRALERLAVSQE